MFGGWKKSSRNEVGFWIRYKGNEKFEDTEPEINLDDLAAYMNLELVKPAPTRVWKDGNLYRLQPDRRIRRTNVYLHVDEHPSHFTERGVAKDDWKDEELTKRGYRNLRIPGELLKKRWWGYTGWCIRAFLSLPEPINCRLSA